jgi:hypothetical protein
MEIAAAFCGAFSASFLTGFDRFMAWVNFSLLFGGLFVAVPIVLHLVMKRKAKPVVFPALRFIEKKKHENRRKLQLRHWLLLLFRILAILLLVLALVRPSVSDAQLGNWLVSGALFSAGVLAVLVAIGSWLQYRKLPVVGALCVAAVLLFGVGGYYAAAAVGETEEVLLAGDEEPLAAAIVVDTSPRMLYRSNNQTRLDLAKKHALEVIRQLPRDSEIILIDSSGRGAAVADDRLAAIDAVEAMTASASSDAIPQLISTAIDSLDASDLERKEIYLFTDMTAAGWNDGADLLSRKIENRPEIFLALVDVGVPSASNHHLENLELSSDSVVIGTPLELQVDVTKFGTQTDEEKIVEVFIDKPTPNRPVISDGKPLLPDSEIVGKDRVSFAGGEKQRATFSLLVEAPGVYHGKVQLQGSDNLEIDDVRWFTFEALPSWRVLVVAGEGVVTENFTSIIAPPDLAAEFTATVVSPEKFQTMPAEDYGDYALISLLDPPPMTDKVWQGLAEYTEQGGSVATFLGHRALSQNGREIDSSFNTKAAQRVLPGEIQPIYSRDDEDPQWLAPRQFTHPAMRPFREIASTLPWQFFPIFRHWVVIPDETSTVIARYTNRRPAVLEKRIGSGISVTMTTPITDPLQPRGRQAWNEVFSEQGPWLPFYVVVKELTRYLVQINPEQLNYRTNEPAKISNYAAVHPERYELFLPAGTTQTLAATDTSVQFKATDEPGNYRLKGNRGVTVLRGFSVNLPGNATNLERVETEELKKILGEGRFQMARQPEEINRDARAARRGREFYPLLMVLFALALASENLLGNRFYQNR